MKLVVFGDDRRLGALDGTRVVDINRAGALLAQSVHGTHSQAFADEHVPTKLDDFIIAGEAAIDRAQHAVEHALTIGVAGDVVHNLDAIVLHAPWPGRRIACAGGNYARHLLGMYRGRPEYENATIDDITRESRESGLWGFWKVPDRVVGPDDDVPFPASSTYLDYEGELAIILGKRGKNIAPSDLPNYVWGVTLINDWSKRDPSTGPRRPMSFNLQKNFDGSTSMGPCAVVGELDWSNVQIETRVNGELRQSFNSNAMIFDFGEILAHLSVDFTFVPGDVIAGGTDAGTAADTTPRGANGRRSLDRFLHVGDTVDVSSPLIGALRNTIVAPDSGA